MRTGFLTFWLLILLSGICYLFWKEDWKYSLPTPLPVSYKIVNAGDKVDLGNKVHATNGKPLFLHFFNPACPCSQFNIPHFKSLVRRYGDEIAFAVVIMSPDNEFTEEDVREKFDLDIPVLFDRSVADSCGVYSTPQAVLIRADNSLYYRGNYNKSRYCTEKETNYAQMAIDSLLGDCTHLVAEQAALKSYGCELPNCTK